MGINCLCTPVVVALSLLTGTMAVAKKASGERDRRRSKQGANGNACNEPITPAPQMPPTPLQLEAPEPLPSGSQRGAHAEDILCHPLIDWEDEEVDVEIYPTLPTCAEEREVKPEDQKAAEEKESTNISEGAACQGSDNTPPEDPQPEAKASHGNEKPRPSLGQLCAKSPLLVRAGKPFPRATPGPRLDVLPRAPAVTDAPIDLPTGPHVFFKKQIGEIGAAAEACWA